MYKKQIVLIALSLSAIQFVSCSLLEPRDQNHKGGNFSINSSASLVGDFGSQLRGISKEAVVDRIETDTVINGDVFITPLEITGKAITVSFIIGSEQYGGVSEIMLIAPQPEGFRETTITSTNSLLSPFNLKDPHTAKSSSATVLVRDNPYPDSAYASVSTVNILFSWVDFTFVVPVASQEPQTAVTVSAQTGLADTHTVRVVYADVTDLGYKRGDRLYLDPADSVFKWIDRDAQVQYGQNYQAVLSTSRPANPVTEGSHMFIGDGTYIPPVSIECPRDSSMLTLPKEDLQNYGWEFTITFHVKNALSFGASKYVDQTAYPQGLDLKTMMSFFSTRFGGQQSLKATVTAKAVDENGIEVPEYQDSTQVGDSVDVDH